MQFTTVTAGGVVRIGDRLTGMPVAFNHTIAHADDGRAAAEWTAEILGLEPPTPFGPFWVVPLANGVSLDFDTEMGGPVEKQHYAFLVGEVEFDAIFGRIQSWGIPYFADPGGEQAQQINTHDGGRGVYFPSNPDGHWLEILTRPYGSGSGA